MIMQQSGNIRLAAVITVIFVVSFGTSRLITRAGPSVHAFTLKTEIYGHPEGQPVKLHHRRTVAVRSDGTRATLSTLSGRAGQAGEEERIIAFLDGRTVSIHRGIAAKTTFAPRSAVAAARKARLFSPPPNCVYPGFEFAGRDTIAGELAVILKHVSEPLGWATTTWEAPGLGCEQLQYQSYDKQPDGSFKLSTEMRTISLVMGEPDPQLFDLPQSGYEEMKPSDILRAYDKKYGHILDHENMQSLEFADRNYFGTLRHEPSNSAQGR